MSEENMETLQEGTTPNAEPTSETAETNENSVAPQTENEFAEQSEEKQAVTSTDNNNDSDIFSVSVNHETRELTRDEALKYAQLGLQKEYLDPFIAKIDYLAAITGKNREEYIEGLLTAQESAMREEIVSKYGEDEDTVNEMLEYKKQKHKKAYENMIAQREKAEADNKESVETRLATEFTTLVSEFPELEGTQFKDLPQSVKQAGFKGENLLSAYLYHKHTEGKKIVEAQNNAKRQNESSVGSMSGDGNPANISPDEQNYLKGLWGR